VEEGLEIMASLFELVKGKVALACGRGKKTNSEQQQDKEGASTDGFFPYGFIVPPPRPFRSLSLSRPTIT
jgi:hypothetical protein